MHLGSSSQNPPYFDTFSDANDSKGLHVAKWGILEAAKVRGVRVDRRESMTAAQTAPAPLLLERGERAGAVAKSLKISRSTLYRTLAVVE